ncbi:CheR family methyltransferase [Roseinatronobacter alkalisoli]|uniref:Chemotaxis protein methyltransferase n=1 Tax=Roseinatronobacter alkalisoli TaxID=3028235 RepID=A0ABT5TBA9_9RHOB|nr:protein-glutamate O-methyltransferase [Roseinatronobacter sp. HJB301]MDD7972419.1 protein-glutamate O-methyltransferase [Roseinatronobacter sp. HJB301]
MRVETPPSLTTDQFSRLARIVHDDSGIVLTEAKRGLLMARLNRRLRALGLAEYGAYCALLNSPGGASERRHMLSAVTTNVTAFFRESHHFDALTRQVLPPLIEAARKGRRVRLWSAACSSGEEPYSMAISVLECFPDAARYDLLILATDIDPVMVAKAQAGVFPETSVQGLAPAKLSTHFTRTGTSYEAGAPLRSIMRFAELNLHHEWPFSGQFDVIFCRNVVIYFDGDARRLLWQRFAAQLHAGGHLFIGHSERLDGPASATFRLAGPTHYVNTAPSPAGQSV